MAKIYTKRGDGGDTGLKGGVRVAKDSPRIEANGALDELNSHLGLVRSMLPKDDDGSRELLYRVQEALMSIMSHVATPPELRSANANEWDTELLARLEQAIDGMEGSVGTRPRFVIPGANTLSAALHVARTVARRAERRLCTLQREAPLSEGLLPLINRLSDYLFTLALLYSVPPKGEQREDTWQSQPLNRHD